MFRLLFIVVAVLAVLLGLLVGSLNATRVTLDLLWLQIDWPLGLVVLCAVALGVIAGVVLTWLFAILPQRIQQRRGGGPPAVPDA